MNDKGTSTISFSQHPERSLRRRYESYRKGESVEKGVGGDTENAGEGTAVERNRMKTHLKGLSQAFQTMMSTENEKNAARLSSAPQVLDGRTKQTVAQVSEHLQAKTVNLSVIHADKYTHDEPVNHAHEPLLTFFPPCLLDEACRVDPSEIDQQRQTEAYSQATSFLSNYRRRKNAASQNERGKASANFLLSTETLFCLLETFSIDNDSPPYTVPVRYSEDGFIFFEEPLQGASGSPEETARLCFQTLVKNRFLGSTGTPFSEPDSKTEYFYKELRINDMSIFVRQEASRSYTSVKMDFSNFPEGHAPDDPVNYVFTALAYGELFRLRMAADWFPSVICARVDPYSSMLLAVQKYTAHADSAQSFEDVFGDDPIVDESKKNALYHRIYELFGKIREAVCEQGYGRYVLHACTRDFTLYKELSPGSAVESEQVVCLHNLLERGEKQSNIKRSLLSTNAPIPTPWWSWGSVRMPKSRRRRRREDKQDHNAIKAGHSFSSVVFLRRSGSQLDVIGVEN